MMRIAFGLATLATLVALTMCGDPKADFERVSKICQDETKTTEAEVKQFMANGMKAEDAKNNVKCHLKCMMEKQGIMQAGKYNDEVALKILKEIPQLKERFPEVEKAVQACKNEKGDDDCETAYKITMCVKDRKAPA